MVDLPTVTPITERFIAEAGARDRVKVATADLVKDSVTGSFDTAVLSSLIQVISSENTRLILKKAEEKEHSVLDGCHLD